MNRYDTTLPKKMPKPVKDLYDIFRKEKYEYIIVGGCIRNYLLDYPIKDYDIATNATPNQMIKLAKKYNLNYFETGKEFGTISFVIEYVYEDPYTLEDRKIIIEVTTYRSDSKYSDNRHPDSVKFVRSFKEDTKRRDLTINSIGYDLYHYQFIDYHDGIQDLKNKEIVCVGNPNDRFEEDPLRMMRAIRFCSQLGFTLSKETFKSIYFESILIRDISKERIRDEFVKILESPNPVYGLSLLKQTRLLETLFPELYEMVGVEQNNLNHIYDVWHHTLNAIERIQYFQNWDNDFYEIIKKVNLPLIMLLHDVGKVNTKVKNEYYMDSFIGHQKESAKIAKVFLENLRFDRKTIDFIVRVIENHDINIDCSRKRMKKYVSELGFDVMTILIEVRKADIRAQNGIKHDMIDGCVRAYAMLKELKESNEPIFLKDLAIDGNDLKEAGLTGKEIGKVLKRLLSHVIAVPEDNNKGQLMKLIKGVNK